MVTRGQGAFLGAALLLALRQLRSKQKWASQLRQQDSLREGKTRSIFITGAASGIGLATARLFAQRGWFVGMYDINEELLADAMLSVKSIDGCPGVSSARLDLTDVDSCQQALSHFLTHTQDRRLDCLFNCAGLLKVGLFEEMDLKAQLAQIRVNFDGLATMTYVAIPALKDTPFSRIVNMASASAFYGVPSHAVYSATKHAVRAFTEALSIELEQYGIGVMDVSAPYIATPMVLDQHQKEIDAIKDESQMLTPEQVAQVVWLAIVQDPSVPHLNTDFKTALSARICDIDRLLGLQLMRSAMTGYGLPDRAKLSAKL